MSNVPPGSNDDPLAPWNKSNKLCRYCDAEELRDVLYENVLAEEDCDDDCVDERVEDLLSLQSLCKDCAKEEYYDYDDDY